MKARLYAHRQGKGDTGVVFIHGNTGSTRWWAPAMNALENEFNMTAVDLRGFGQSPDGPDNVTLADHAGDVKAVADEIGLREFILVGHSLGGGVAMQFAALFPDRLRGLVLVDPAPLGGLKGVDYGILEMSIKNNWMVPGLKATMVQPVAEEYFALLARDCIRSLPAVIPNTRALEAADFTAVAPRFAKPVLVVQGDKDPLVPLAEAEKIAAAYPHAALTVIADAGHSPQVEQTGAFARCLREFAANLPGGSKV